MDIVKKILSILCFSFIMLISILPTSNVFAQENIETPKIPENQKVPTSVTEYNIVPKFDTNQDPQASQDPQEAPANGGYATVSCYDGGHTIAACDTEYRLYNDQIRTVSATVYLYQGQGIYIDAEKEYYNHGGKSSTVYGQANMVVLPGTYYSELWGTVTGFKGPYTISNIKSRSFTVK
ncbi:hypothetical protein GH820_25280 [Bacillus thuringiensis]|nr:hypothetical protein [Bacillus thuringiensis]